MSHGHAEGERGDRHFSWREYWGVGRELSFTVLCGGSVGAQGCNGYGPGAEVRG